MRPRGGLLLLTGSLLTFGLVSGGSDAGAVRSGGHRRRGKGRRGGVGSEVEQPGGWRFPYPPDTRPRGCRVDFPEFSGYTVSILIPWLNETWQHLEGTLRALLHFTPDALVEEILFISDGNADPKERELTSLSTKVRVLALPRREGLIRAKMRGVDAAKAPVIVFMEAHCIVNRGWLPPLLERVQAEPRVLAMPFLDYIPPHDWTSYHKGATGHWRHEWNFNLIYTNPGGFIRDTPEVFPSPSTSAGIFAMRADWFRQLRLFDTGMGPWGGDHFEITMKVWRCGGRIEIVPCSRVGHFFRLAHDRPYEVEISQVVRNYARLSRIWTQDHLEIFYKVKNEARFMTFSDMEPLYEAHAQLVKELECKDMTWYLENIDHEMRWEMDKICVPNAPLSAWNGCAGPKAPGRSTIDVVMPRQDFVAAQVSATVRRARERRSEASECHSSSAEGQHGEPRDEERQYALPIIDETLPLIDENGGFTW